METGGTIVILALDDILSFVAPSGVCALEDHVALNPQAMTRLFLGQQRWLPVWVLGSMHLISGSSGFASLQHAGSAMKARNFSTSASTGASA
jgi:hypothetical protein